MVLNKTNTLHSNDIWRIETNINHLPASPGLNGSWKPFSWNVDVSIFTSKITCTPPAKRKAESTGLTKIDHFFSDSSGADASSHSMIIISSVSTHTTYCQSTISDASAYPRLLASLHGLVSSSLHGDGKQKKRRTYWIRTANKGRAAYETCWITTGISSLFISQSVETSSRSPWPLSSPQTHIPRYIAFQPRVQPWRR